MGKLLVAEEILRQLGGNKFIAMTGAKDICGGDDFIQFRLGANAKGVKGVNIRLTDMDDYEMIFYRQAGRPTFKVDADVVEGVYSENLIEIFKDKTGLDTSL